ncbi:lipoprotein NlpA, partial [Klebsiella pneumoniae]|nr:lipoprotein NlpA [Klebsiella pneumoniae]
MTLRWRITPLAAAFAAVLALQGCDQKTDQNHIKVGVINGAEQDVAEVARQVAKEKY